MATNESSGAGRAEGLSIYRVKSTELMGGKQVSELLSLAADRVKRLVVGFVSYGGQVITAVVVVLVLFVLAFGPPLLVYRVSSSESWIQHILGCVEGGVEFVALVAGIGAISYVFTKGAEGVLRGLKAIGSEMLSTLRGPWQGGLRGFSQGVKSRFSGLLRATGASAVLVLALFLLSIAVALGKVLVGAEDDKADAGIVTVDFIGTSVSHEIIEVNGKLKSLTIIGNDGVILARVGVADAEHLADIIVRDSEDVRQLGTHLGEKLDHLWDKLGALDSAMSEDHAGISESSDANFKEMRGHLDRHRDQIVNEVRKRAPTHTSSAAHQTLM